jgi:hypothetical protein
MTVAQFGSLALFLAGVLILLWARSRSPRRTLAP